MAKITAIEAAKKDPNRVSVYLDGHFGFDLASILAAWLKPGQDLDEARIASLQADDRREQAYQRALQFLSPRNRSESELRQHLRKHKVAPELIEHTLGRLRSNGVVDDAQFARGWIENRTTFRPRSRRALSWELRQKGVSTDTAETVLAAVEDEALAYQAGLKKAQHLMHLDWNDFRTKLSGFLARRGFSYPVISATVSRLWQETHSGQQTADDNEDTQ